MSIGNETLNDAIAPVVFRCRVCRGPIRFVLDAPYCWPRDNGPGTYSVRSDDGLLRAMMPNECESCRLGRATNDQERDAIFGRLAELGTAATSVGLSPSLLFTLQLDWWLLRDDRPALEGFSVRAYGLWSTAPPEHVKLAMPHLSMSIPRPDRIDNFLVLYPLVVIQHPDNPAELHIRGNIERIDDDPETIIANERGASVEQLKQLMEGLSLYRAQSPLGRRTGSGYFVNAEHFHHAYRAALASLERENIRPTAAIIAYRLGVGTRTYHDYKRKWGLGS